MMASNKESFLSRHGLGLTVFAVVAVLILLYAYSDPETHHGAFFGNAIADWTGLLVTIMATKYLREVGSAESKKVKMPKVLPRGFHEFCREHGLIIFLVITGVVWVAAFMRMSPNAK